MISNMHVFHLGLGYSGLSGLGFCLYQLRTKRYNSDRNVTIDASIVHCIRRGASALLPFIG